MSEIFPQPDVPEIPTPHKPPWAIIGVVAAVMLLLCCCGGGFFVFGVKTTSSTPVRVPINKPPQGSRVTIPGPDDK